MKHIYRAGTKTPTRLSLGMRSCPGRHTQLELISWIEEVRVVYFFNFGEVDPQLFLPGTD